MNHGGPSQEMSKGPVIEWSIFTDCKQLQLLIPEGTTDGTISFAVVIRFRKGTTTDDNILFIFKGDKVVLEHPPVTAQFRRDIRLTEITCTDVVLREGGGERCLPSHHHSNTYHKIPANLANIIGSHTADVLLPLCP